MIDAVDEITFKTKKITMIAENEITMESKKFDGQLSEIATLFGKNEMNVLSQTAVNVASENKVDIGGQVEVSVTGNEKVSLTSTAVQVHSQADTSIAAAAIKLNC